MEPFIDLTYVKCNKCGIEMEQFPPEWIPEVCPDCATIRIVSYG